MFTLHITGFPTATVLRLFLEKLGLPEHTPLMFSGTSITIPITELESYNDYLDSLA